MKLFNLINYTNDNTIIFNKKTFVKNKRYNKYTTKDGLDRIIYKCTNNRKFEHLNKNRKGKSFCNATIIKILEAKNKKQKLTLKERFKKFIRGSMKNYVEPTL